jgi:hypothetical protein
MPFRDTIRDYRRSAQRRLEDAQELLEPRTWEPQRSDADQRHLRTAMYLAGYAVECLLKAYLIQQIGAQTLREAVALLNVRLQARGREPVADISRSAAGHRLIYILRYTDLTGYPGYSEALWGRLAQWNSAWRYETDPVARSAAEAFIGDVQTAVNWLSARFH